MTYTPLDPDDSPHKTADGGLRSLGGMTYAGLKSFLYAGVSKDDPRVKAAVQWIRGHYTLDENPGQGQAGLFYYYHTFAKAMDALGESHFEDAASKKHDWRKELFDALKKRQNADGSWINPMDKFGENNADLAVSRPLLSRKRRDSKRTRGPYGVLTPDRASRHRVRKRRAFPAFLPKPIGKRPAFRDFGAATPEDTPHK